MTRPLGRQDDGTWPLPGARIGHARRRDLRRDGYGIREGFRAVRRWALRGLNSADVDVRPSGGTHPVLYAVHWDRVGVHDGATLDDRPWHGRISTTPPEVVDRIRLRGKRRRLRRGVRIRRAEEYLDGPQTLMRRAWTRALRRPFTPFFELKEDRRMQGPLGAELLENLHAKAVARGARYAVMAMPQDGGLQRLAVRGPAFGLLLSRGPVTPRQWAVVDGAKGPARWLREAPPDKRLYGPGRPWGGSRITR